LNQNYELFSGGMVEAFARAIFALGIVANAPA
jgi:hypothetical protein